MNGIMLTPTRMYTEPEMKSSGTLIITHTSALVIYQKRCSWGTGTWVPYVFGPSQTLCFVTL